MNSKDKQSMSSVVLITGASTGFGRDASETLARRGHRVFATMRGVNGHNSEHRESLLRLANSENLSLEVLELDVTDEASVQNAIGRALEQAGQLDVVINNAGFAGLGVTEAYTPEQFQRILDVNLYGVVRVNRAVLPSMRQRRSGLLIHVSSVAGRVAVPGFGAYCASKFALEALADAYRFELQLFGIDSVLVEPGAYRTPIFDRLMQPADAERLLNYGRTGEYVQRVLGVIQTALGADDAPGPQEVTQAFVRLVEMTPSQRPFRTVVSAPLVELLESYNGTAEQLRPAIAQMFNVSELAGPQPIAAAA
ncbi:MAG: SDR family oxidoreductase [Bryobacteraceae bacterium]|nr:SDR family oxidoreductase [Bryobacteraceae bacterium]